MMNSSLKDDKTRSFNSLLHIPFHHSCFPSSQETQPCGETSDTCLRSEKDHPQSSSSLGDDTSSPWKIESNMLKKDLSSQGVPNMSPNGLRYLKPGTMKHSFEHKENSSPYPNIKIAYENMLINYFMPEYYKNDNKIYPTMTQSIQTNANDFSTTSLASLTSTSMENIQSRYVSKIGQDPTDAMLSIQKTRCKEKISETHYASVGITLSGGSMSDAIDCNKLKNYPEPKASVESLGKDNIVSVKLSSTLNEDNKFVFDKRSVNPMYPPIPFVPTVSKSLNMQSAKKDIPLGQFSVLPPLVSTTTPVNYTSEGDSISLMSCNSPVSNAQNHSQVGAHHNLPSTYAPNFSDNYSVAITPSSRYSGRSSYSSRSRNKRALSNSPLSAEGIDINTITRMSPTSLSIYLSGSRSSSSSISLGSNKEKIGCYGHLSARNSSSSTNSGSSSIYNRLDTSQIETLKPSINQTSINIGSKGGRDDSYAYGDVNDTTAVFPSNDAHSAMILAGQVLPASPSLRSNASGLFNMQCDNLQVMPQDLAVYTTQSLIPFSSVSLPLDDMYFPHCFQSAESPAEVQLKNYKKPPPTYDQHMARKAVLQEIRTSNSVPRPNSSTSKSLKEANNNEIDPTISKSHLCRWQDCNTVFQDQDEFVNHIEKSHVDQKTGDDFVCYWQLCPRRLHPFSARYKLLVHMRVHSGDKPNKCTFLGCTKAFSRLENLKIHLRSHTGEKPYACIYPGCTKTFNNSSDRTKHQKTHNDTKPYVCQVAECVKRYTDPSSLRKHIKKSHPEKKEPYRKKIRGGMDNTGLCNSSDYSVVRELEPVVGTCPLI